MGPAVLKYAALLSVRCMALFMSQFELYARGLGGSDQEPEDRRPN